MFSWLRIKNKRELNERMERRKEQTEVKKPSIRISLDATSNENSIRNPIKRMAINLKLESNILAAKLQEEEAEDGPRDTKWVGRGGGREG